MHFLFVIQIDITKLNKFILLLKLLKNKRFHACLLFIFYYCLTHQPAPEEGEEKGDDAADDIDDAQAFLRNVRGFYPKCDGKYPRYCKQ